ncbi:hypothetical protein BGZ51_008515 [Haplosporangium sp. Z 767]|nr:hypothetical protein BGZ50_008698 [Haplosporangium sp. Z 11]KAF9177616.1 hypothetical protein BGZ51_008515 [Haplosporangium sp. Z 767]
MGNRHDLNVQFFELLNKEATRVIGLDADLCSEDVDIMKSLRSDFLVINNTFQHQKDDKVVLFDSKVKLIAEAQDLLRAGKRLWISSTMSAKCNEALDAMLIEAGFKGECVTKNTEESKKRDIGKNINTVMIDLDYFIHTPTISVGVGCNVEDHVDYVFGIFDTHSEVDVETCIQMMRQVRHIKSKTYLVYADAATNNLPTTTQGIKDWICNQHGLVTGKVRGSSTLKLRFDNAKNLVIPDDLYHRMYCHVMAKKHQSMNGFRSRLIQRMARAGCIVTGKSDKLPNDHPIIADLKREEEKITAALHQQIAGAAPISPDEFEELSFGARELSAAQQASVRKFALMLTYDVQEHSIVTEEWVKTYDNAHEKECYKNLFVLSRRSGPNLKGCLSYVQKCEELGLDYSLRGATSTDAHSKLERSQFVKLEYVVDILMACGFEDTFATNEVLAEDLKSRIDGIWKTVEGQIPFTCTTLKKRRPRSNNWTFKNKLAFINKVLHEVLGVKIITSGPNKHRTKYSLKHYSSVGSAENNPLRHANA